MNIIQNGGMDEADVHEVDVVAVDDDDACGSILKMAQTTTQ
jgi:hypothetical protein